MKLHYYTHKQGIPNFGDDLNPWLWGKLIPNLQDIEPRDSLFVGIGTLLNNLLPKDPEKIIFGSGAGYGKAPPLRDETWQVYFVRGPHTATLLGLTPSHAITDPAILIRKFVTPLSEKRHKYAFMPHWENANTGWESVCEFCGFHYIDPRKPLEEAIADINASETLLAEAMHGAIVADCLRIPWIPVQTSKKILSFKWLDWCDSLNLKYQPFVLPSVWAYATEHSMVTRVRAQTKKVIVANRLHKLVNRTAPTMSSDTDLARALERVEERLFQFKKDFAM